MVVGIKTFTTHYSPLYNDLCNYYLLLLFISIIVIFRNTCKFLNVKKNLSLTAVQNIFYILKNVRKYTVLNGFVTNWISIPSLVGTISLLVTILNSCFRFVERLYQKTDMLYKYTL